MQTSSQVLESPSQSSSWQLLDQHAYDCLSNTLWFIEQHIISNKSLSHIDKAVITHYVMQHPGVWNNPSDVTGVHFEFHRLTIQHNHGEVYITMPELHD